MGTDVTLFGGKDAQLPAHLQGMFDDQNNVGDGVSIPSLGYEGMVWTISIEGNKKQLMRTDDDGEEVPVPVMKVIIAGSAARRGRAYYEGSYDPDKPGNPVCWSADGETPDSDVPEKTTLEVTSTKCATCPMAQKGSRVTDQGKEVQACSSHRMLAVLPVDYPDAPPLRMKIAVTSDYDANSPDLAAKNYYAFSQYRKFLKSHGVMYTGHLVTKMRFDPKVAFPKVVFSNDRWTDDVEAANLRHLLDAGEIEKVLKGYTPEGADGQENHSKDSDAEEDEHNNPPEKKAASKTKDSLDGWDEDDDDEAAKKAAALKKKQEQADRAKAAAKKNAAKKEAEKAASDDKPLDGEIVDDDVALGDDAGADAPSADLDDLLGSWDE